MYKANLEIKDIGKDGLVGIENLSQGISDVIFSYFIENEIYDMIELDIQLEEHGQKCLIS
jgi:hypothetical protein